MKKLFPIIFVFALVFISCEVEPDWEPAASVYVTASGTKFHRSSCRTIARSSTTSMSREGAVLAGYAACAVCKP
jgi:hypothetical protein